MRQQPDIKPVPFSSLPGWAEDAHEEAFATFLKSCQKLRASSSLKAACAAAGKMPPSPSRRQARDFFEQNFHCIPVTPKNATTGFVTGYFEPVIKGSPTPTPVYSTPVYARPKDLVMVEDLRKGEKLPEGRAAARRTAKGLTQYWSRTEIEQGAMQGQTPELLWLDPIDAFFSQIQGSARVSLESSGDFRLSYDGRNGHPYYPIGRDLIERGIIPAEKMSLDALRAYMQKNPQEAVKLRQKNPSYVFFRLDPLTQSAVGPSGAQGLPLTALRSIAIDPQLYEYGTLFWISASLPLESADKRVPFRKLLIAQDTGSAITGPARADIYFGHGARAGETAGRIRHPADFFILTPK